MNGNSKKVGVMTFHIAHNYGAMLQAYALPTAVKKLGYDCEVIDYRFPYIDKWSRIEKLDDLIAKYGYIGGFLRFLKRTLAGYYSIKSSRTRFDSFERNVIPHSIIVYRDKKELNNMPYDVILFGSDQIWNSALTNGVAEEYVGGFECLPKTKRVAYAASCGTSNFQPESKDTYIELLSRFSAIGVREKGFCDTLCGLGFDAFWVLDPTLLLNADDWKQIIPKGMRLCNSKYLLVYAFDVDEQIYDLAREYAEEKGLEIVAIAYRETPAMHGMNVLVDCGPLEFLSLFVNAEHIIAASFHGTVFSIVFHKNFHCVPHPKYRDRTDSLLNMLGLQEHNIDFLERIIDKEVDWDAVENILSRYRDCSLSFLRRSIENE